jgi:RNA polymerase sigma-70 factor (ECF subfamily)
MAARDDAFFAVLTRHRGALHRVVASYARSAADREDLMQEVALAIHRALPTFRHESSELTFVLRVAHNRGVSFAARRGAAVEPLGDHAERVAATSGKNPLIALERAATEHKLMLAVRALPLGHRQVLTLLLEGLGHREIAEVLGSNENAVGVRVFRARAALRVLLSEDSAAPNTSQTKTHQTNTSRGGVQR